MDHTPSFHIDTKHKREIRVEAKLTWSSFQSIERNTEPLELIHSDICDFKSTQTRGGNKYLITFVDDSTEYYFIYLPKNKDKVIEKFILYKHKIENQLNRNIKELRSGRSGGYQAPFFEFCAQR